MSTNYYAITAPGLGDDHQFHIGKSSAGNPFSFHVYPDEELRDGNAVLGYVHGNDLEIRDEYGTPVAVQDIRDMANEGLQYQNQQAILAQDDAWLDEDGYTCCAYDFF